MCLPLKDPDLCTVRPLRCLLITLLFGAALVARAQSDSTALIVPHADTLDWRHHHSAKKASILSAVAPGAGQIYNRKYWKAPVVWAGLGVSVYFITENTREYRRYKDAYIALTDNDPTTIDEFEGQFSPTQVLNVTDTYRRWRDLSYIAIGAVYILNIVDASVDAHFVRFDVGRDLSLDIGPSLPLAAQQGIGLKLALAVR